MAALSISLGVDSLQAFTGCPLLQESRSIESNS